MPTVDLPQGTVQYRIAGPEESSAPPVVFVHGLLVNGELWTKVADDLAAHGIRSYAPDLPLGSHSIALKHDTVLTPADIAALIHDFLVKLDLTDVTLVGNDTGGALCQFLIDADPSRVGRLVLTNCDAFDQFPPAPFGLLVAAGRSERRLAVLARLLGPKAMRHSPLGYGGLVRSKLDPALTERWVTPVRADAGVRHDTAKFLRGIRKPDLVEVATRLNRFDKPVTLVWGTSDRFFRLSLARRLRDAFPHANLVEVPDARTFVPLDAPDQVAHVIRTAS